MAIGINLGGDGPVCVEDFYDPKKVAENALRSMDLKQLAGMANLLASIQAAKFKELVSAQRQKHGATTAAVLANKLEPKDIQWVVNSIGELGVCLAGNYFFMSRESTAWYKGYETTIYHEQPDGERLMVRSITFQDVSFAANGRNHLTEPEGTWKDLFPNQEL